jgi:energy-coupling factor transporter ATP-binding protein EcfA2
MKFNTISIPIDKCKDQGLAKINIERLSSVVAFVGRNGSGKTRIINLIEATAFEDITISKLFLKHLSDIPKELKDVQINAKSFLQFFNIDFEIEELKSKLKIEGENEKTKTTIQELTNQLGKMLQNSNSRPQFNAIKTSLNEAVKVLKSRYIRRIKATDVQSLTKAIGVTDEQKRSFEQLLNNIKINFEYNEFTSINAGSLEYLLKLPHELATDKIKCIEENLVFEEQESYKKFLSLKKFVYSFLKKDLTWERFKSQVNTTSTGSIVTNVGIWKINGRNFNYSEFSDGEKTLFTYSILFFLLEYNPKLNIKESIILIDEPELHLHPDSEIDLINGLREVIEEKGQLIIATHSINILSHLNYEEIFMVKDGAIFHPNHQTVGKSLNELMSLEVRVSKLGDLLNSISTWSYVNFIVDCFTNPDVIESSRKDDPQFLALKNILKSNLSKESSFLLDFGAGKGRLYEQIKSDYDLLNKISYTPLEPELEFHKKLRELGATNVLSDYKEIPPNSFNFILLCNVLHELSIDQWEEILNFIIDGLTSDGYLIIIEAKTLTKGEKIGSVGYLLLDTEEIMELFGLNDQPVDLLIGDKSDKITSVAIPKINLERINKENIINCLKALEVNTLKKIEILRSTEYNKEDQYKIGHKAASLSTQNINAKLALQKLQPN